MESVLLLALAILGALDAAYFVAVTYRWMAPDARFVPAFCRMDAGSCASIVDTRWARVFGLPNAVWGLGWYVIVAAAALGAMPGFPTPWCAGLLVASGATVAFSALLFWAIVWRLRTRCPLCFAGHAINVAIFLVLLWLC